MKINWLYTKVILLLCLISSTLYSQNKGIYVDNTMISIPSSGETSGELNFITPCNNFYVKDGKVWVKIDLGENYELGSQSKGIPFNISLDLDIKVLTTDPLVDPSISFTVQLNNNQPESVVYLNLSQYIDKKDNSTGFSYLGNNIKGVEAIVRNVTNTVPSINVAENLKIKLNYEINYGIDVSLNKVDNLTFSLLPDTKVVVFNWEAGCSAPGYEFQILRLYNIDPSTIDDQRIVTTPIDWDKALSLHVDSAITSIDLTMGQGQGYYTWRVRPIGTYEENGIGNSKNWGNWNELDYPACTSCIFNPSTATNQVFFFEDLDDNRNYQYNRVFTEGNKISEQVTYATTLNQVKQIQKYLPSKDYKVITQTVLDNSGRPTLTTLPVPITGEKINKYKEGFVKTSGELYKAEHFDGEDNYNKPSMIDATAAFEYYSSANPDKRIADAEGYPFTRVLFSNDGTDRVVEQSGVGKTHMIGNTADRKTRTTRTLYGTATENELVHLFGDEAPNHQDVAKIITIDPNGTRSVAYITKEGKTIATGLTFSDDSDVLQSVKETSDTNESAAIKDRISNNIKMTNGFAASKRITILKDATDINISYIINKQVLEGLCNNLELDLDYKLKIEIFDVNTGVSIHTFEKETIKDFTDTTDDDIDNITVDFGTVTLDAGSYYVQKTLTPSDNIKLKVVAAQESIDKLIKPFFNWLVNFSGEIDCKEEMEFLYHDIFHFGQIIYNKNLDATIQDNSAIVDFNCEGCSQEKISFMGKDPNEKGPNGEELDDEFLDFYRKGDNREKYAITVFYFDESGALQPIDYGNTNELGNKIPAKVRFKTPCCEFEIPIVFTPPFRVPDEEAVEQYARDATLNQQVIGSTSYYAQGIDPLTAVNSANPINPNPNYLLDVENNFTYDKNESGTITLKHTKAYPLDFEGYAISMLYECRKASNADYKRETAAEEIYSYMRGWHRPGVFNQMVYHMVTDKYSCSGEELKDPNPLTPPSTSLPGNYHICDIPKVGKKISGTQYAIKDLADCWEPIVIDIVNRICVSGLDVNSDADGKVADNYDERDGDSEKDLNDNIKGFLIRWIAKPKLIKKIRSQNVSNSDDTPLDEAMKEIDNAVKTFLSCTGFAFADVIESKLSVDGTQLLDLEAKDFNFIANDVNLYDRNRLKNNEIGPITNWNYFTLRSKSISGVDYETPPSPPTIIDNPDQRMYGIVKDLFPFIKDPVFAFKYYEYFDRTYPTLEAITFYNDPNICFDVFQQKEVPCCTDFQGNAIDCNFCEIGYIKAEDHKTKYQWSCGQRLHFYELLKNYREEQPVTIAPVNCDNYFEAKNYVDNPDFDPNGDKDPLNPDEYVLKYDLINGSLNPLGDFKYLSDKMFVAKGGYIKEPTFETLNRVYLKNLDGVKGTGDDDLGVSIAEEEAFNLVESCETNCNSRADEFRTALIKAFEDRCYVIGDCKVDTNDNIVPEEDIDALVNLMIEQCQKQCEITTFACVDETCRLLGSPTLVDTRDPKTFESYTVNLSSIDYGVSGPVVDKAEVVNKRKDQFLKDYNPSTKTTNITDLTPTVTTIGSTATNPFEKYSYENTSSPSSILTMFDIRQSLNYAQSTRKKQAEEWPVKLDIPSKCDSTGKYNRDLTYDSNNLPEQPVYVYNNETKLWEVQSLQICTHQDDYVTVKKPEGPGETFVERDAYITTKDSGQPSGDKIKVSPKTGIILTIDPSK